MTLQTTLADDVEEDGFDLPASPCPACDGQEFGFVHSINTLICYSCGFGFRPHEYAALQKTVDKVN